MSILQSNIFSKTFALAAAKPVAADIMKMLEHGLAKLQEDVIAEGRLVSDS